MRLWASVLSVCRPPWRTHRARHMQLYKEIYISLLDGRGRGVVQQMAGMFQVCLAGKGIWPSLLIGSQ